MDRLPVLVEHGAVIWKAIAAVAAVLAIAVVRRRRARWEQRAAVRERAARAARATAPVQGKTTVRGTLRGGGAASVSILHLSGPRLYYDERAPRLWLDCDGERVALRGPIRVVRGSRLVATRDRRSAVPDDEVAVRSSAVLHRLTAASVSVRDGDEVFVTAKLAPGAGGDAMGYRDARTAWTATPAGKAAGAAIEVIAAEPVVHALPFGATRTLGAGLAGAALAIAMLWGAGQVALWWAGAETTDGASQRVPALGELEPVSLAAATPGNRGAALAAIEARFALRYERTAAGDAQWRQAARLRGGCGAELEARIAQDEIDGLAGLARGCDDDEAAAGALQFLGLYREAQQRDRGVPLARRHIESLIATASWETAASWVANAADRDTGPAVAALGCAEQWFRWCAGTARAPHAVSPHPTCGVIAALSAPQPAAALSAAAARARDPRARQIGEDLAWAAGASSGQRSFPRTDAIDLHRAMFDATDRAQVAHALLSQAASARDTFVPGTRDYFATLAALSVREMLRDAGWTARAWAWRVARGISVPEHGTSAELDDRQRAQYEYGHALDVAFAVRTGAPLPPLAPDDVLSAPEITEPAALWRDAWRTYWNEMPGHDVCGDPPGRGTLPLEQAVRIAADGNAQYLGDTLAVCRLGGSPMLAQIFAVWPRIRGGRDRLAEVLRRIDLGPPAIDPLAVIARGALRRDLARLTGDARRAEAWQAILDRHLATFSDYSRLTALMVRELIRPAAAR